MATQQFVANTASTPGSPLIASLLNGLVQCTSYVLSGGNPGTSASLSITVPQTQAVVLASTGIALWANVPSTPLTLTASRDTYLDLVVATTAPYAGSLTQVPVANGAAPPALTANSVRLCKVVTSGTAATTVVDLRPLSPQATAPGVRQIKTGVQGTTAGFSSSTAADWPGTPVVALTTQLGGSLLCQILMTVNLTVTAGTQFACSFYANVDGANTFSGVAQGYGLTGGGAVATVVGSAVVSVTPGPHVVKIQAATGGVGTNYLSSNPNTTILTVSEVA